MKRILMIFLGVLFIAGCSKEEKDLILGVWDIDYSYIGERNVTARHTDWSLTWIFREDGFGYENGELFNYQVDPERKSLFIHIHNTNDKKTWNILGLDTKVLHVAYFTDTGLYIHYIFNRAE